MLVQQHGIPPYPRDGGEATPAVPKRDGLASVLCAFGSLLVVAALLLAAYPHLSSAWGAYQANRQLTEERSAASFLDQAAVDAEIADAEAYNDALAGQAPSGDRPLYDEQLDMGESGAICWLEIPSIDVRMPVYRDDGTDEVPTDGAEHMRGTSLPVGGSSSNTVITAHSGSHAGTPMAFNKLDYLVSGDLIVLWTLGRPYAYEVSGSEQTAPDDVSGMRIEKGIDQLTLLTCRPIGTTAKRLFVHARRIDYSPASGQDERIEMLADPGLWGIVALPGLIGALWLPLLVAWRSKRIWYFNRAFGAGACTEDDVAAYHDNGAPIMGLEFRRRGKARLRLFGAEVAGTWERVTGDRSSVLIAFDDAQSREAVLRCVREFSPPGVEAVRFAHGSIKACSLDDELSFLVDGGATRLVFSRYRPQTREGSRGRWGRVRR